MNNCKICQNQETFNLPVCNHPICKNCSNQHIFNKVVNHNNLDFLQCPICNTYVQIEKIEKYIDEKDYKLITDLIDDRKVTFGLGIDDALVRCFKCSDVFLVNKGLQIVKCFNCKQEICKNCNREVHKNLTCAQQIQQFLQSKENSIQKPLLEEQIKEQKQQENKKQDQKYEQQQEKQQYQQVPINYQQNIFQQNQQQVAYYPIQQQQNNYQVYQQNHNQIYVAQDNSGMRQQQQNYVINQQQIINQQKTDDQAKQIIKGNNQQEKIQYQEETQDEYKDPGTPTFTKQDKKQQINKQIQNKQEIVINNHPTAKLEICIICFDPVGDIKLPICAHSFCRSCLNEYLLQMVIKPKCVDQLMCPNCQIKIEIESLQLHLDKQIFNKISDLILEKGQIYGLSFNETIVKCIKCENFFAVSKQDKVARCASCFTEICMKCNRNYHKDMSCEEAFGEESKRFLELGEIQGWVKCPQCTSTIERIQGCNFMRCESSQCKKNTFFCFLCKQLLTKDDHYKHFKNNRPYNNECEGTLKAGKSSASTTAQNSIQDKIVINSNQQAPQCEICIICFDPVGDIKLPICGHPFCRTCLNEYLLNMVIKPKLIDQLMCPYCRTKLEIESVQQHLDKQIFDQISDLIVESGQINGLGVDDALVKCFQCEASFLINKGLQLAKCPYCQIEICRKCNKNSHQDMSCEEFAKINIDDETLKFQQFAQAQGWIKCPKCNQTIERIKGCNFIRCESSECKRRTFFCFLCRQSLTKDDHYKHFHKNNPYLNECQVTLEKQKEFLKTKVTPEKSQEQIKQQVEIPRQNQQIQPANQIKYENNFRFTIETPNVQNKNLQYQYVQQVQPQNQYLQQPEQVKIVNQQIQNQQIQQVYQYGNNQQYATVTQSVQHQNLQYQPVQIQFEQPQYAQKQQYENQEIKIGTQPVNTHYQVLQQQIQQTNNKYQIVYQQVDVRQHQQPIQQQNLGQQNNQFQDQQLNQEKGNADTDSKQNQMKNNQQQAPQNKDQQNYQGQEQQQNLIEKPKIIKKIPVVRNIPQTLRSDPSFGPPETEYNQFLLQILTQNCRNCANELEVLQQNIRQCQECENRYCNKCFCQIFSDHVC